MTAPGVSPRSDEEIRADLAVERPEPHQLGDGSLCRVFGCIECADYQAARQRFEIARDRLVADLPILLVENAKLREIVSLYRIPPFV